MLVLIIGVISFVYMVYLWFESKTSLLNLIPQPSTLPIIHHTHHFLLEKDHIDLLERWGRQFNSKGIFRIKTLLSDYGSLVIVLRPDIIKEVLSNPQKYVRSDFMHKYFPLLRHGLLDSTGESHRFQKRLLGKAFALQYMKYYIPTFQKHVDILIKIWKDAVEDSPSGKNLEVKEYFNSMSFDIIGELGFGCQFNSQITSTHPFVEAYRQISCGILSFRSRLILGLFPFMWYMPFGPARKWKDAMQVSEKILNKVVETRKEKIAADDLTQEERSDILSIMMMEKDEKTGKGFTDDLVKANAFTFLLAGHETTATTLPGVLLFLAKYQHCQEKAREEINEKLTSSELTSESINSLVYTSAFLKECVRLFPAVPFEGRDVVEDCTVAGYKIPKGTGIYCLNLTMNKYAECFDNPEEFMPERYIEGSGIKNGTILSFGYGPYNCIGKNFAMQEMKVVLVRLLQNFRFEVDSENLNFYKRTMLTINLFPSVKIRVIKL